MARDVGVGQQIGRYRILSELGRGSMGRVYLAEDPNIERRVALKVFSPEGVDEESREDLRQRFVTEAKAAGRLSHPGIVTIYDAGTDPESGDSYIAMEWVEGETLHEYVWRQSRLVVPEAVDVVIQVARALDYAHRDGVIHRDVKPANILVGKGGRVRVMDFGIAKLDKQSLTLAGVVLGTPAYMSPEQVLRYPVDGRSDVFSLGTVLYMCLTGESPFEADSIAATTYKIAYGELLSVRTGRPEIPAALAAVVDRALHKSPDERYQTAAELVEALAPFGAEPPDTLVEARPDALNALDHLDDLNDLPPLDATLFAGPPQAEPPPGARPERLSSRIRIGAALGALVALALGAAIWSARSPEPAAEDAPLTAAPIPAAPEIAPPPEPEAPAASPAEEGDEARASAVSKAAIEVLYVNRLREGRLSVRIDGVQVWTRDLTSKNPFRRMTGQRRRVAIPVAAGRRSIEVRIQGMEVDASRKITASLPEGITRQLRVSLKRRSNEIDLEWIG